MPSSHPIPSIPSLALSLFISSKKVQPLPRYLEVQPYERACFVVTYDNGFPEGI
jgi:hypothetical protein